MTAFVFLVASTFPFWALPISLLLLEYANRCRFRREYKRMWTFGLLASVLILLSGVFFYFNGHKNIEPALRAISSGDTEYF